MSEQPDEHVHGLPTLFGTIPRDLVAGDWLTPPEMPQGFRVQVGEALKCGQLVELRSDAKLYVAQSATIARF